MKKLLTILGAVGLMATTSAAVVACGGNKTSHPKKEPVLITKQNISQIIKKVSLKFNVPRGIEKGEKGKNPFANKIKVQLLKILTKANYTIPENFSMGWAQLPSQDQLNGIGWKGKEYTFWETKEGIIYFYFDKENTKENMVKVEKLTYSFNIIDGEDLADVLKDNLDLGEFVKAADATKAAQKVIEDKKLTDKVEIGAAVNGKINVTAKKGAEKLFGETDFIYKIKKA